ncbi:MAG: SDR family oxidoreductase [Synergistaceae bacterium]|nr:SDR family oxidoreductase [Synergistaceae bacterium]
MLLHEKTAIITGTNRGIGLATLEAFAANGAKVYAHARRETPDFLALINDISRMYGIEIWPVCFDLTDYDAMKQKMKEIAASKRSIDILVNNAGAVADSSSFLMTSVEKMKAVFEVNFFAQMALSQYVARMMMRNKRAGMSIVNVASAAGIDGDPAQVEYSASKAALIGATKKLAIELNGYNIRVNAVAPGVTDTDMVSAMDEGLMRRTLEKTVMNRKAQTGEIAGAILFLASGLSSFMTGQVLRVDGGM